MCECLQAVDRDGGRFGLSKELMSSRLSADEMSMGDQRAHSAQTHFAGTATPQERRRYPRHAIHLSLELHVEGSDVPLRVETSDISRNGCYIETIMPFRVGTKVEVKLWLGETRVVVRGRIVTSHPQFGNGIMFLDFDGDGEQQLRCYLDSLAHN